MAGAGTHLHRLIKRWTRQDYTANCGCKNMVRRMNKHGPAWCRTNIDAILAKMRAEATNRGWWKFLVKIPGATAPMRWMILEAIRRSEQDG